MKKSESTQTENAQGFLRLPEVLKLIPVSKATWWAGVKTGRYPPSRHLGPRATAWLASHVLRVSHIYLSNLEIAHG
jgi:prophage regulatory protein